MDHSIKIWDETTGALKQTLGYHTDKVNALGQLTNGSLVSGSNDNNLIIYDLKYRPVNKIPTGINILSMCLIGTDVIAIGGNGDFSIRLYSLTNGTLIRKLAGHGGNVNSIKIMSNGTLISGSDDRFVKLWDVYTGNNSLSWNNVNKVLAMDHNGNYLIASAGDGDFSIRIWSKAQIPLAKQLVGHTGRIRCLKWLSFQYLASGSDDYSVKIWDVWNNVLFKNFQYIGPIFFSLVLINNNVLAAGYKTTTGGIVFYDTTTWANKRVIIAHSDSTTALVSLKFRKPEFFFHIF